MLLKQFTGSIAIAIGLLAIASISNAQTPIEWKYYTFNQANDNITKTHREFATAVREATGGRLNITVFGAGELPYSAPDMLKSVATNQIQMADIAFGLSAGDVPELNVLSLPFLCASYEGFDAALPAIKKVADKVLNEKFGLTAAVHFTPPPQNLWSSRPITTLGDFKGLKVRTWNPAQVSMMRALGGSPVSINPKEVITSLQRKVIDAVITGSLSANDWRAYDVLKNGYLLNISMGHMAMIINNDELNKLPEDVRKILLDTAAASTSRYRQMSELGGEAAVKNLIKNGVVMASPTAADLSAAQEMVRPIWNEWATANGEVGKTLLQGALDSCK